MDEYIESMVIAGYTNKTIISRCKKKDFYPTDNDIQQIRNKVKLKSEIEQVNKSKEDLNGKTVKGKVIIPLFTKEETYFDFASRIGVDTEYSNIDELIGTVQKLTANIFIKQAICLLRGLELLSEGHATDLDILYKGYDVAFKAIDKAWGIQVLIDINSAIYTLNNKGFKIDVSTTNIPQISE